MNHFVQFLHELGAWRDGVISEVFLTVGVLLIISIKPLNELFIVPGAFKSSGPLIVHFGSWSHTV